MFPACVGLPFDDLLPSPAHAVFGVLQKDALLGQLRADGVGAREVAGFARLRVFGDEAFDVGIRKTRRLGQLRRFRTDLVLQPFLPSPTRPSRAPWRRRRPSARRRSRRTALSTCSSRGTLAARTSPASAAAFTSRTMSKIAPSARAVFRSSSRPARISAEVLSAISAMITLLSSANCEVSSRRLKLRRRSTELAACVSPSKVKLSCLRYGTDISRKRIDDGLCPIRTRSRDGVEVARALGHLLAFNQQKARMHPEMHEGFAGHRLRLRDFVFVMREDEVLAAADGCRRSRRGTSSTSAEHSMCQPGRPGPISVSQNASPGFGAFHSAKSRALSLSYSSTSTRAPSVMPAKSFFESLPYSGNFAIRK